MRPFTVSIDLSCRPLFARRLPVVGLCGGGKSGFRRVDLQLHRFLKHLSAKVSRKVSHLLLAAAYPVAIRRVVHGFHHRLKVLLHFLLHRLDEFVGRNLTRGHGSLLESRALVMISQTGNFITLPNPRRLRQSILPHPCSSAPLVNGSDSWED